MIKTQKSVLGLTLIANVTLSGAAIACEQYDDVVSAVQADDVAKATALYEEISVNAGCDDAIREWVADYLARDAFLTAMSANSDAEKRENLQTALGYEKHWRSYYELGHLSWSEKNYGSAATNFQRAINELIDGDPSHEAEESEIAELYQLASASMALADAPIEMPRTRSGNVGGIFETKIRGFSVEEVPLPITFEYNSTEFDEMGATYADVLVEHLLESAPNSLRLSGHTDPRGDELYNEELSEARANALKEHLLAKGFSGEIEVFGFGESQLPEPPEGIEPDSEEYFRIARRVAFQEN